MNKNTSSIIRQQGTKVLLLFLTLLLYAIQPAHARQSTKSKPLEIGDKVPEITLRNVINHTDSVIYPEQWKGKLVILSFWATWCQVCVEQIPKLAELQKQFRDQLLIIPVTQDDSVKVRKLLNKSPAIIGTNLHFATSTVLNDFFPHRLLPHEVWIDPHGKLVAITGHEDINIVNIQKFLDSSKMSVNSKADIIGYNVRLPLFAGGLGSYKMPVEKIRHSRALTSYIPGIGGFRSNVLKQDNRVTIKCTNTILQDLYVQAIATNPHEVWPKNKDFYLRYGGRIIWEARDSTLYSSLETRSRPDRTPDSLRAFNYEIILPRADSARINEMMLNDLNDYFGHHYNLVGRKETREVDSWVLVCLDSSKLVSGGGKQQVKIDRQTGHILVNNATVDEFMFWWLGSSINMHLFPYPIVNETGLLSKIDLDVKVDPTDFEAVKKAISAYGLEFRREKRLLDMIVISNKK